ncbi:MAG: ABC-F family ATP-binding cassette domain-containing protein [Eubacteriales bacterium]|nr:ABC-F family ATP-binding cassette domain-containing protein [Eubacteriales bacterium]
MNVINIERISKIYGDKVIFEEASFGVQEGDKIGIVGINGTGKTTLLRMVSGEEKPDDGQIIRQNGRKIAFLTQNPEYAPEETVESYAMDGNPETDWKVQSNLNQLGITDYSMKMENLSGGQRRRAVMAKVLAGDFDILLLDEPTNHLDEAMIRWLEEYLKNFRGTILMVTHDRYFLDKVTNRILEISRGKMYSYDANYSGFLELKAEREEMELATERKRQSVLRMELEWAKRGCRARTTKQKARLERLEALKNGKAPIADQTVELDSIETRMGKKTIELSHVTKSYGGRKIVDDFDYILLKNQRLGVVGPNGCGKSTLLKMIAGEVRPDTGSIEIGETVKIGYFAQEEQQMDDRQRVIDYVKDIAEYIHTSEGKISASSMLERFLFTPDMQYAPIGKLSGGEKRRLYLLGVLCKEVNVLILDEPGNNLDIPTLTILEDFLDSFVGIVITVSHDRYFLDNVVDRIFAFEGEGHLVQYEGGYTDYLEARERKGRTEFDTGNGPKGDTSSIKTDTDTASKENAMKTWKQNRPKKLKFSYKEQQEYDMIDEVIASIESQIEKLDKDILQNATNSAKLSELMKEKERAEKELEEKMDRWVYLNELNERIQNGE